MNKTSISFTANIEESDEKAEITLGKGGVFELQMQKSLWLEVFHAEKEWLKKNVNIPPLQVFLWHSPNLHVIKVDSFNGSLRFVGQQNIKMKERIVVTSLESAQLSHEPFGHVHFTLAGTQGTSGIPYVKGRTVFLKPLEEVSGKTEEEKVLNMAKEIYIAEYDTTRYEYALVLPHALHFLEVAATKDPLEGYFTYSHDSSADGASETIEFPIDLTFYLAKR